jgi:hypothetical protein
MRVRVFGVDRMMLGEVLARVDDEAAQLVGVSLVGMGTKRQEHHQRDAATHHLGG